MLNGNVRSSQLRELLRFEAEKHGIAVRYREEPLESDWRPPVFRREATIVAHFDDHPEQFGIRLPDGEVLVRVPATLLAGLGQPVGYTECDGGLAPLGAVIRDHLFVFLSLEALARPGSVLQRRPRNGSAPPANILGSVFDLVVGQAMPFLKANIETYDWRVEKTRFAARRVWRVEQRISQTHEDIAKNDSAIGVRTDEIRYLVRQNEQLKESLRALEHDTLVRHRKAAEQEYLALIAMVPRALEDVVVHDERIEATTPPILLPWEEHEYALGRLAIEIELATDRLKVRSVDGVGPGDHPHPHVSAAGVPCLGNIGPGVAKLLAEGHYAAVFAVLLQFLRSYTPGDAYTQLEGWDPDWADERWQRCYENASINDCLECGDGRCPFHEDRYERCFEYHRDSDGLRDCIRCGDCGNREDAENACHQDRSLSECIGCTTTPCSYAGRVDDMDECREASPDRCADCDVAACAHRGRPEEEGDDDDEKAGEEENP